MIREVTGDILLSKADAMAHAVAPLDDFKQGLALSIREQWPALYKDFRHYCQTANPKPGTLWSWKGPSGPVVINLLTQEPPPGGHGHPGRATLPNVNHALHALKKEVERRGIRSLAITRVSTGVGGLSWDDVKPLLIQVLGDLRIPVYVYSTYAKGAAAEETT